MDLFRKISGTFFLTIMLFFSAKAQNPSYAELEVRLSDQSLFTLNIDQYMYPSAQYVFTLKGITSGCHILNLTRLGTNYYPVRTDTLPVNLVHQVCLMPDTRTILILDPRGKSQTYTHGVISTTSPIRSPEYSNLYPERVYNPNDSVDYVALKQVLANTAYDRIKADIIKEAAFQYGISSNALAELLPQLTFDKDRIMLATYCYGFCRDPQEYWRMKHAFIFSNSYQMMIEKVEYYYPGRRRF